jgi:predicted 3-demethylubiquinone-9 3-methyltransferase (glyoxalase superfamily)
MPASQKITPCLWFVDNGLEAAELYVSLIPNSRVDKVMHAPTDYPGGKAGDVLLVEFTLAGQSYQALNGGEHDRFNDAISLSVACEDQAEVDRLWDALTADGGQPVQCGWLKDKYGLAWQIVPEALPRLMRSGSPAQSQAVMQAMMPMVKLDVAALQQAYDAAG